MKESLPTVQGTDKTYLGPSIHPTIQIYWVTEWWLSNYFIFIGAQISKFFFFHHHTTNSFDEVNQFHNTQLLHLFINSANQSIPKLRSTRMHCRLWLRRLLHFLHVNSGIANMGEHGKSRTTCRSSNLCNLEMYVEVEQFPRAMLCSGPWNKAASHMAAL
jgi:hypothetical protein